MVSDEVSDDEIFVAAGYIVDYSIVYMGLVARVVLVFFMARIL